MDNTKVAVHNKNNTIDHHKLQIQANDYDLFQWEKFTHYGGCQTDMVQYYLAEITKQLSIGAHVLIIFVLKSYSTVFRKPYF